MRSVPFVDADGVVLWESHDEHEARRLLRTGNFVPVWGSRRIVALQYAPQVDELMARNGNCWSPTRYSDGAYTLNEIPEGCEQFFSPRWKSIFRQPARPSVFLPDPTEKATTHTQLLKATSVTGWLLRSFAAYSPTTGKSSGSDTRNS